MKYLTHTTIGHHRNTRRIYIDSVRLATAGFQPGTRFNLETSHNRISIKTDRQGDFIVSQKTRGSNLIPVIDINNRAIEASLSNFVRAQVRVSDNSIEILPTPNDADLADRTAALQTRVIERILKTGSICHGFGALTNAIHQGLHAGGFKSSLSFALDIDPVALETSLRNNPVWTSETQAICASLADIDPADLPKIDMLEAGLPCVGASIAGRAKLSLDSAEEHPTAGALFVNWLHIVRQTNPSIIVFENVPPYRNTPSYAAIRTFLQTRGYDVHEKILNGAEFGAIEARNRLCMVALPAETPFDWADMPVPARTHKTIGDLLETVSPDSDLWCDTSYLDAKEQRDIAQGKGFRRQIIDASNVSIGTIGAGYAKRRSSEPMLAHPTKPHFTRLLTPTEHARAKTIDPALVAGEAASVQHRLLGNSVIHNAFNAVGKRIAESLLKPKATNQNIQKVQETLFA